MYYLHCNHTLRALRSEGVNLHASNGIFLGRAYDRLRRRTKSLWVASTNSSAQSATKNGKTLFTTPSSLNSCKKRTL